MSDFYNKMYTDVSILKQSSSEVEAEVSISHKAELDGEVSTIGGGNYAFAAVDVIPPPKVTLPLNPIRDTFVRSDMPTVALGTYQSMYSGIINGSINSEMFIGFDLTKIPKEMNIVSAKLKLYPISKDATHNINLYTVNKEWQENNITWVTKPGPGEYVTSGRLNAGDTSITIDLLNYVKQCYKGTKTDTGFTITTDNSKAVGFYTKESKFKPELIIQYYDPSQLVEISSMDAEVNVFHKDNSELEGEILVKTEYTTDNSEVDAEVYITKPEAPGEVTILTKSEVDGEVTIYYNMVDEMDGDVCTSNPEQQAEVIVAISESVDAEVSITQISDTTQDGEIIVFKDAEEEYIGEVDIITSKEEDSSLDGELFISNPEVGGEVIISTTTENEAEVILIQRGESLSDAEVTVERREDSLQDGEIDIITSKSEEDIIDAEITILVKDRQLLDGEVDIVTSKSNEDTVDGDIIVCTKGESLQDGEVDIVTSKLDETILDAEVIIEKGEESLQEGEVDVITSKTGEDIIEAEITILRKLDSTQEAEVDVITSRSDQTETHAEVEILPPNEIYGEVNIYYTSYMDAEVTSAIPYVDDMEGEVTVIDHMDGESSNEAELTIYGKGSNTQDAEVTVILNKQSVSELDCEVTSAIPYVDDMDAEVIITTTKNDSSTIDSEVIIFAKGDTVHDAEVSVILNKQGNSYQDAEMSAALRYVDDVDAEVTVVPYINEKSEIDGEITVEPSFTGYLIIM